MEMEVYKVWVKEFTTWSFGRMGGRIPSTSRLAHGMDDVLYMDGRKRLPSTQPMYFMQ